MINCCGESGNMRCACRLENDAGKPESKEVAATAKDSPHKKQEFNIFENLNFDDAEVILLSDESWEALQKTLANPPSANQALIDLMKKRNP